MDAVEIFANKAMARVQQQGGPLSPADLRMMFNQFLLDACADATAQVRMAQAVVASEAGVKALAAAVGECIGGSCGTGARNPCADTYVPIMQQALRQRCDMRWDDCAAARIAAAIADTSWALAKDQVGRSELTFQLTGAVGTGAQAQTTPPTATTFVAGPAIPPSSSLLVVQDLAYALPWRPGCAEVNIQPADGVSKEDAYSSLIVTSWVIPVANLGGINRTVPANPVGYYGARWSQYQIILGSDLYCDNCLKKVPLKGPCVDDDWIGKDAVLLLQIDNTDNANTVTFKNAKVDFKGMKKICCDACAIGAGCGCK